MEMDFYVKGLVFMIFLLVSVAYLTMFERNMLGLAGFRLGPNKCLYMGVFQPIFDALKLAGKEEGTLGGSMGGVYVGAAFGYFVFTVGIFSLDFHNTLKGWFDMDLLFILVFMSLNASFILSMGWSSNSSYSAIGSMRAACLAMSYETLLIISFLIYFCYQDVCIYVLKGPISCGMGLTLPFLIPFWVLAIYAEAGRTPYDFSEGESELVSGFHIEYGSGPFALVFLGEYTNLVFLSYLTMGFFLSDYCSFFVTFFLVIFVWMRAAMPRSRMDYYVALCWYLLFPIYTMILVVVNMFLY